MGSTYTSLNYHVVFSTKERQPLIREWHLDLYSYMGGTLRGLGGTLRAAGGIEDHIHILASLKPSHCLSDIVRDLKKQATIWVKDHHAADFGWQDGYAAFSVGPKGVDNVKAYIANQREHHKKHSFIEELRQMLDEAGIPYEGKYLF